MQLPDPLNYLTSSVGGTRCPLNYNDNSDSSDPLLRLDFDIKRAQYNPSELINYIENYIPGRVSYSGLKSGGSGNSIQPRKVIKPWAYPYRCPNFEDTKRAFENIKPKSAQGQACCAAMQSYVASLYKYLEGCAAAAKRYGDCRAAGGTDAQCGDGGEGFETYGPNGYQFFPGRGKDYPWWRCKWLTNNGERERQSAYRKCEILYGVDCEKLGDGTVGTGLKQAIASNGGSTSTEDTSSGSTQTQPKFGPVDMARESIRAGVVYPFTDVLPSQISIFNLEDIDNINPYNQMWVSIFRDPGNVEVKADIFYDRS